MKKTILITLLFTITLASYAQENKDLKQEKTHAFSVGVGMGFALESKPSYDTLSRFYNLTFTYEKNFTKNLSFKLGTSVGHFKTAYSFFVTLSEDEWNPYGYFYTSSISYNNKYITGNMPLTFNFRVNRFKIGLGSLFKFNWVANTNYSHSSLPNEFSLSLNKKGDHKFGIFESTVLNFEPFVPTANLGIDINERLSIQMTYSHGKIHKFGTINLNYNL